MADNPFDSIDTAQAPAQSNPFDTVVPSQAQGPADANLPHQFNFGDAIQSLGQTFMPNPVATQAAFFNPGATLQSEGQLAERYPQGIIQSATDLSQGKAPDLAQNFFSPKQNPFDAITMAQNLNPFSPTTIANPDSHMDYLKAEATNFIKDLPFTTLGVTSEFANPNNAFLAGAISHLPNINIPAPAWVDNAVKGIINFAGGPFSALNDVLKERLADHLADTIHNKVQQAPGWMDQFKQQYGPDTTSDDVRDLIKNKIDVAVQNENPSAIDLAKTIFRTKGQNLPGVMIPSKGIMPPGEPIMADQYAAAPQGPVQPKPVSEMPHAEIHTAGANGQTSVEKFEQLPADQRMQHLTHVQFALDTAQEAENRRAENLTAQGIPTAPIQYPSAIGLDPALQQRLVAASKKEMSSPEGNDQSVQNLLLKMMHRLPTGELNQDDLTHTVSAITMHPNKEQAAETPEFDWRTLQHQTIQEIVQRMKDENAVRAQQGLPLIDPEKDLIVHRNAYDGQEKGLEEKVRDALILYYGRAKPHPSVNGRPPSVNPFDQIPTHPPSNPFDNFPIEPLPHVPKSTTPSIEQAVQKSIENLPKPLSHMISKPEIGVTEHKGTPFNFGRKTSVYFKPEQRAKVFTNEELENKRQLEAARPVTWESLNDEEIKHVVLHMEAHRIQQVRIAQSVVNPEIQEVFQRASSVVEPAEPSVAEDRARMLHDKLSGILLHLEDWSEGLPSTENWIKGEQAKGVKQNRKLQDSGEVAGTKNRNLYKNDTYREDFGVEKDPFAQEETPEMKKRRAELLAKDAEKLNKAREYLGQVYLPEIMKLAEDTGESINAVNGLKLIATRAEIERAIGGIKSAINKALREVDQHHASMKDEIETAYEAATEPADPMDHADDIGEQVKFDNGLEKDDKSVEGEDLMYMANPGQMVKSFLAKLDDMKVRQFDNEPRECPTPALLAWLRQHPLLADIDKYFTFKFGGDKAMELRALELKDRYSSGEAKLYIQDFAMYEGSIKGVAASELRPFYSGPRGLRTHLKAFLKNHPLGIKVNGENAYNKIEGMYRSLMAEADEQVIADVYPKYYPSRLGDGPHKSDFGRDAYVESIKKYYDFFKKPYTQADIIKWNTQRSMAHWDLLKDPLVMDSGILQEIILFHKAQVQNQLLAEKIKNGMYSNADIQTQILDGYHKKNYGLEGEQAELTSKHKNFFSKKQPLGSVKSPEAKYYSQQEFIKAAQLEGWKATNDFFLDAAKDYEESHLAIKQSQLLKEISKLTLPKLEFLSDKWVKALSEHPITNEMTAQLRKVHSSGDKIIQDIVDHMSKALGEEVTAMKVLQEGGWIQSHQDDGLNKWYRGSFQPPFVYKTLYDMIQTVFRTSSGFDTLPGFLQLYMTAKQMALTDSLVHVPQYIGNAIMNMPIQNVPGAMVTLPVKSTVAFFKGLAVQGPSMLKGTYAKDIGETPEERQWARAFTENGLTMTGGINVYLHHMIGKADDVLFSERTGLGDRITRYLLSGFGTTPSVLGEMIGQHALKIATAMTKEYIAQGMDPQLAIKTTVYRLNTSMNNLNQVSWQGSRLGSILSIATFSKNFAVMSTRIAFMATQALVSPYVGKPKFKTSASGGAGRNVFTGADIPEQIRDQVNSDTCKGLGSVLFWTAIILSTTQAALWNSQSEEYKKEHPDEEFWWKNKPFGAVKLFINDQQGRPVSAFYNMFRLGQDVLDQMAPLIDLAGKGVSHNPRWTAGLKGPVTYTKDKLSAALAYLDLLQNKDPATGGSIWDTGESEQWKKALQGASFVAGQPIPINPWAGPGKMRVPIFKDPYMNNLMSTLELYGIRYKTGVPYGAGVTEGQAQQERKDEAHEQYLRDHLNIETPEDAKKALIDHQITRKQYINFFKKENPNNYFKQHRRDIQKAEAENNSTNSSTTNPFDAIENPEFSTAQ